MEEQTPPPQRPLWDGIYNYVWHPDNGKSVFIATFCFVFLATFVCGFYQLRLLMVESSAGELGIGFFGIAVQAGARIFAALTVLTFIFSIFPCACFIRIIESTAAGDDRIHWSQGVWLDFLKDLFYLLWIFACSAALPVMLLFIADRISPLSSTMWWIGIVGGATLLLPLFLLSTMMGNAPWILIHFQVINRFLQEPAIPAILYLNMAAFAFASFLLGYWMMTEHFWWFPVTGVAWAIYWFTSARLLGRVGWMLTEDNVGRRNEKRQGKLRLKEATE